VTPSPWPAAAKSVRFFGLPAGEEAAFERREQGLGEAGLDEAGAGQGIAVADQGDRFLGGDDLAAHALLLGIGLPAACRPGLRTGSSVPSLPSHCCRRLAGGAGAVQRARRRRRPARPVSGWRR
jgi:hypothetical protein